MVGNNQDQHITTTLYKGAPAPLFGTLVVVFLTCYYLLKYTYIPPVEIYIFLSTVVALVLSRAGLVFAYIRNLKKGSINDFKKWEYIFLVPTCLTGIVFGAATFIFHNPVELSANLMLYIAVLGLASGASVSYYSSLPTLFSFLFTCTLPTIYSMLFRSQDPRDALVGIMSVFWLMICVRSAKVVHRGFLQKEELYTKQLELHRLRGLNKLAGGVAHEINNPLAIIYSFSQLLRMGSDKMTQDQAFDRIEQGINRIKDITQSLLAFSEPNMLAGHTYHRNAGDFIKQIFEITHGIAAKLNVTFHMEITEAAKKEQICTPPQLAEALTNIIINGLEAADRNITSVAFTKMSIDVKGGLLEIRVQDSGVGFDAAQAKDIFLPFYSTKDIGEGKGLGLTVARSTIKHLGGSLSLDSSEVHTTFVVLLPMAGGESQPLSDNNLIA